MADDEASKSPQKTSESVVERMSNLADYSRSRLQSGAVDLSARVKEFKPKDALDAVLEAPDRFKREWQKNGATGAITHQAPRIKAKERVATRRTRISHHASSIEPRVQ